MSDLISRQDAIDILDDFEADIELGERDSYKTHREKLLSLPSADRPTGEWIQIDPVGEFECSQCGWTMIGTSKFCPDCGAKMVREDGEEE